MNQQQYSVLFYSQYSSNCKKMTDILHNYAIPIQEVCVDNEKIRKQILTSKNIKIENVPCILIAYADGGIELFTGSNAFGWLEDVISKILPPSPVITNEELPYTSIPLTTRKQPMNKHVVYEEDVPVVKRPVKRSNYRKNPLKSVPVNSMRNETAIENIESEEEGETYQKLGEEEDIFEEDEEDEDDGSFQIKKPVKGIRTDAGNYEIGVDFGEAPEPQVREVKRGIKSSTQQGTGNKSDIISAAQNMQKLREKEDSMAHPNKMMNE